MLIVADIGGTNSRLALYSQGKISKVKVYSTPAHDSFEEILERYLRTFKGPYPEIISVGIAGTVKGDSANCVNLSWSIQKDVIKKIFGFKDVILMNDFEAAAWGITGLGPEDLIKIGGGQGLRYAPRVVLGAGTGLGEAIIVPCRQNSYHVLATEGGHTDFAPSSAIEWELFDFLEGKYGHVSVERVVSGPGIQDIYEFLTKKRLKAEEITRLALSGRDEDSKRAISIFLMHYAREAANLALKTLSRGGVYISGGIALKIKPFFQGPGFRDAFEDKGRMKTILQEIPIFLAIHPYLGLLGAGIRGETSPT